MSAAVLQVSYFASRIFYDEPDLPGKGQRTFQVIQDSFCIRALETVLRAMQAGDKEALALACTAKGYQSIVKGQRTQEATPDDLKAWGKSWSSQKLRFASDAEHEAHAKFGPEVKEHGVWFIKTADGWKLDRWEPGKWEWGKPSFRLVAWWRARYWAPSRFSI